MRPLLAIVIGVCFVILFHLPGWAERSIVVGSDQGSRVALVIGNADYKSSPLQNPVNDARDMADALQDLGFEVIEELNAERQAMEEAVERFYRRLNDAQAGFLYYAGHGVQIDGTNYLLPIDIRVSSSADIKYKAVKTDWILAKMEDAKSRVNIVVLDACRDNPFRGLRGAGAGLAPIQSVRGSFIAYATAPGSVGRDGSGRNGIYTKHLLQTITTPGLTVEEIFRNVRKGVAQETNFKQIPWDSSSLMGAFYLAGGSDLPSSKPVSPNAKTGSLLIWTEPEGAAVYVNDTHQGEAPVKVSGLKPKSYRVEARKEGFVATSMQAGVRGGKTSKITLQLEPFKQTGYLYVQPMPPDARVRIMNIVPKYHDGIELEPGEYRIRVDKKGYESEDRWVDIAASEKLEMAIELVAKPSPGRLFVRTTPSDAKVRLLNSDQSYHSGMELKAGRYRIEVSKSGFKTISQWLRLSPGEEKQVRMGLERSGPLPGEPWTDPVAGMEFVWVPGGCYMMGSNDGGSDEKPVHEVCVDRFWMGKYEVTQGQWLKLMKDHSYFQKQLRHPVNGVSWLDCQDFLRILNRKGPDTVQYRLPTEAEWEYAARSGGKREKYAGGEQVNRIAWHNGNSKGRIHEVGTKTPNGLALYDMSGNVSEWCQDVYDTYTSHYQENPLVSSGGSHRVNRGGSWSDYPWSMRVSNRRGAHPADKNKSKGFRICVSPITH